MLTSLHIRNFALIDNLELIFGTGLNLLTGETGAGKSIIIDALGSALGERASIDSIRSGAEKFTVEAVFTLDPRQARTRLKVTEHSLENEDDPDTLVLVRELTRSGKSQARVNGRLVPVSVLRTIGADLVDVHGQHEHQSLLSSETHIDLLDNWLGKEIVELKHTVTAKYDLLLSTHRELDSLRTSQRARARNIDLYSFQANEIREADLTQNELAELTKERLKLTNSEKLLMTAEEAYFSLREQAQNSVNSALSALLRAVDLDPELAACVEQAAEASAYLEEAISLLRHYRDGLESEPGRLEMVNERLDVIHSLQRKYGDTVEDILSYLAEIEGKLNGLEDSDLRAAQLERSIGSLSSELSTITTELTRLRTLGARQFSAAIESELVDLGMLQTRFDVSLQVQTLSSKGVDKIEFVISPNPGEPLRPLAKIASGGETSRLMLAIKSVLLRSFLVPTMIFDEIDTGVGGRTGRVIADKLATLSTIAQIMCITHLPQIASRPASAHFFIEKQVQDGRTTVDVVRLTADRREQEIARMLGGDGSQTVLQHAREMLSAM